MDILKHVPVGGYVPMKKKLLKVEDSSNGCTGCNFQNSLGGENCKYRTQCFGHHRNDRKSVIFRSVEFVRL